MRYKIQIEKKTAKKTPEILNKCMSHLLLLLERHDCVIGKNIFNFFYPH